MHTRVYGVWVCRKTWRTGLYWLSICQTRDHVHLDPHTSFIYIYSYNYYLLAYVCKNEQNTFKRTIRSVWKKTGVWWRKKITEIFLVTITYYPTYTCCGAREVIIVLLSLPQNQIIIIIIRDLHFIYIIAIYTLYIHRRQTKIIIVIRYLRK